MGGIKAKAGTLKTIKHYIKFLACCKNQKLCREALKSAPEGVIKAICNAALNAMNGDIALNPREKSLFKRHRRLFTTLTAKNKALRTKRKLLVQKGGAAIIPLLLSTVLSALGSGIISKIFNKE